MMDKEGKLYCLEAKHPSRNDPYLPDSAGSPGHWNKLEDLCQWILELAQKD